MVLKDIFSNSLQGGFVGGSWRSDYFVCWYRQLYCDDEETQH